jgi:hypothetical protein
MRIMKSPNNGLNQNYGYVRQLREENQEDLPRISQQKS